MAKLSFEPLVEPYFLGDSYGYRPGKSAHQALAVTRERCWRYDWVLEFDIRGLFDNIDHHLLMKAVKRHTDNPWLLLVCATRYPRLFACAAAMRIGMEGAIREV